MRLTCLVFRDSRLATARRNEKCCIDDLSQTLLFTVPSTAVKSFQHLRIRPAGFQRPENKPKDVTVSGK